MTSMLDTTCRKCRKRFGFADHGQAVTCPSCGAPWERAELDGLLDDLRAIEAQQPIRDALMAAVSVVSPGYRTTALKQLATEQGWDWVAVKAFIVGARSLPEDLVGKMTAWMGVRT